jgi:hypothetical protein
MFLLPPSNTARKTQEILMSALLGKASGHLSLVRMAKKPTILKVEIYVLAISKNSFALALVCAAGTIFSAAAMAATVYDTSLASLAADRTRRADLPWMPKRHRTRTSREVPLQPDRH